MYVVKVRFADGFDAEIKSEERLQVYAEGDTYIVQEQSLHGWDTLMLLNREQVKSVQLKQNENTAELAAAE